MKCIYEYSEGGVRFRLATKFERGQYPESSKMKVEHPEGMSKKEVIRHFKKFLDVMLNDLHQHGAKIKR